MSFMMKKADRPKIIKALNMDLGLEIGAIVQYLYHHVMAEGMERPAIIGLFEKIAKMKWSIWKHLHAYMTRKITLILGRLFSLKGPSEHGFLFPQKPNFLFSFLKF